MSDEVKENILRYIKREVRHYKLLYISWFGGEPLLNKNFLINFISRVKAICVEEKTPFISNITTNGYNLDINTFHKLVESNLLFYQITLDGTEAVHNFLRPHVNPNCNSFIRVLENLVNIKKTPYKRFRVSIRVNVSHELLKNLDEFMHLLQDNFSNDKRFSVIWHQIRDWGGMSDEFRTITTESIQNLSSNLNVKAYQYNINPYILKPKVKDVLCSACKKNAYIIDTYGNVSKCVLCHDIARTVDINKQNDNRIGYIDKQGYLVINKEKEAKWIVRNRLSSECRDCSVLPVCLEAICPNYRKFSENCINCTADKNYYKSILLSLCDETSNTIKIIS